VFGVYEGDGMRNKAAALGPVVMMGLLGACEFGDDKPSAPKPPPRIVHEAMGGLHIDDGGRGAKVYRTERTPTGGWVIYFEAKPSDPFLIYPPPLHGLGCPVTELRRHIAPSVPTSSPFR
jgi:hypothetical protein